MSGEPAIRKVLERLKVWVDGNVGAGVTVWLDRPFDEPFRDEELPCLNLRCQRVDFQVGNYSSGMLHEAAIAFDIITRSALVQTIDQKQAEIAADLVARIGAMNAAPGGIGELLSAQNNGLLCTPLSMGGQADEFDMADQGVSTFLWRFVFLTPINDFRTIIGQNGTVA